MIADVFRCDLGDVLVRRNGAVVRLQEHHHFHPVGLNAAAVRHEEVAAAAEVSLDLRCRGLIPEGLLRDRREKGEGMLSLLRPIRQHFAWVQLKSNVEKERKR